MESIIESLRNLKVVGAIPANKHEKTHFFNKAFLARQVWRLLKNIDSLISRIFKAKYYPISQFLQYYKMCSSPSFAWRILRVTLDLFNEGFIWQVDNGHNIKM